MQAEPPSPDAIIKALEQEIVNRQAIITALEQEIVNRQAIITALEQEIVNRHVRIKTLEVNVTALQLQIQPLNEENCALRAQVAWVQANAMDKQEQLSKLAQVNQSLTAEIQGLRHALCNLSQENTNLRTRLDSTRAPAPPVTAKKASVKTGNARLQVTMAYPVAQQLEVPTPVPVTILVQQESEAVHVPTQAEQEAEPAKGGREPEVVPVSVMAQQESPVQSEVQEDPPVQPEVQEVPVPVSTAEETKTPTLTPIAQPSTRTEEERAARREEKRARERAYKAQQQAAREMQAAEAARVAAEKQAEAARVAAEKQAEVARVAAEAKAKKEAIKQAEAREKERRARETQENARRAREKAEKRMQAQLAREQEQEILERKKQAEQERVRLEKQAEAKKVAEEKRAKLAEAERESKKLQDTVERSLRLHDDTPTDPELLFAFLMSQMKEEKVKDPAPRLQKFVEGMTPAKALEYSCRALYELDTPCHGLKYDEFECKRLKIKVPVFLQLRAIEQFRGLVDVALKGSDQLILSTKFNGESHPLFSPKVSLETISHWLDSKKFSKVMEDFSEIQTARDKSSLPAWTQKTVSTAIESVLKINPKLFEDLKTDFDPAGDETDYWGMKMVQITYKKKFSDDTTKTVTESMTRAHLIDWYLLGHLYVLAR